MSSLYIKLFSSFFAHRKTLRLRARIGDDAFWIPPRLWAYAAENQPDGDFSGYSSEELAMLIGCDKHASSIRQALVDVGFLDSDGRIHDWAEHNGYHKTFSDRAKNAANVRWGNKEENDKDKDKDKETSIASSMQQACSKHSGFSPPELGECIEYGATVGLVEDECLHFRDHYEANGWMRGKTKMKCWKASMRTWKRTSQTFGRNGHQNQNPPAKPTFVRIKELNTRIDRHPANWESVKSRHHDPTWTPEQKEKDKAELKALRAELAALEEGREITEQSDEP